MRIAMVAPVIAGGISTYLSAICQRLSYRNIDIDIITSRRYCSEIKRISHKRHICLTTIDFPMRDLSLYGIMPSLSYIKRQLFSRLAERYDILHLHGYTNYSTDYLTLTRKFHEMPIIIQFHGSLYQYSSLLNQFYKTLHNKIMTKFQFLVSKFVVVSYFERNIATSLGIPYSKIEVIYNGVDENLSVGHKSDFFKEKLNIPQDDIVLLYVGRLSKSKSVDLLVKAMKYLLDLDRKVWLVIMGPDWGERSDLERLSTQLGVSSSVFFVGEVAEYEKATALSSADIFVYPALRDIFSLSVIEASAACTPVVAFATGANSEMIIDGYTGLLARERTPRGLARAICMIIERGDYEQLGKNGQQHVLRKFSWDETAINTEWMYRHVLGE